MKTIHSAETITIPKEVDVSVHARIVRVKGPRGELVRSFKHMQCHISIVNKKRSKRKISIEVWFGTPKEIAVINTICSHIKNMITGVTKGFERRMRYVYAHFPINTAIADDGSEIRISNFLGEKVIRHVKMLEGVKVARKPEQKDEIFLQGNDIEKVSQSAALIHQSCLVKEKDIRKFLDGIYVSEKNIIGE